METDHHACGYLTPTCTRKRCSSKHVMMLTTLAVAAVYCSHAGATLST